MAPLQDVEVEYMVKFGLLTLKVDMINRSRWNLFDMKVYTLKSTPACHIWTWSVKPCRYYTPNFKVWWNLCFFSPHKGVIIYTDQGKIWRVEIHHSPLFYAKFGCNTVKHTMYLCVPKSCLQHIYGVNPKWQNHWVMDDESDESDLTLAWRVKWQITILFWLVYCGVQVL